MTNHVSIEHHPDGRTVACKRSTASEGGARIRDEARRIDGLDHPGVLTFVELREADHGPILVTEYVGPRTLASVGSVTAERAAELVADLATTVADLHAQGVVHGAIRPEHVLVAGERTVLCGLAPSTIDAEPADDVHGIGVTLRDLLDPELEEEPIPDRRPWRRTPWHGYRHRALLTLADQATDDDPTRRPAARALADAVGALNGAPAARLGPQPASEPAPPTWGQALLDLSALHRPGRTRLTRVEPVAGRRRPSARVALLGGLGIVLGGLGMAGLARAPTATDRPRPIDSVADRAACPRAGGPTAVDVDGDGCPEPVRIGHGWVDVDGHRFRVGRPGNALAVGDWDGDGAATIALLQRGTGDVWRFPTWDPDAAVTAEPAGHYPGALDLERRVERQADVLVVRLRDGETAEVPAG